MSMRRRALPSVRRAVAIVLMVTGSLGAVAAPTLTPGTVQFPLSVAPGGRYLADAAGQPFLLQGDSAWSLMAALKREEVDLYLDDRRQRGFNAIVVSLIEHRFSTRPPANAYGQAPFFITGDYATPNEAYFQHADWVLRRAGEKGFLVVLAPSYLGANGGNEGWYAEMAANGPAKLREYGRYLGRRYGGLSNILWLHGGDYNPPRQELMSAIAEGIQDVAPHALHTVHGAPETAALDQWRRVPSWLRVNTLYTYGPVTVKALEADRRPERIPFFLMESGYENEHGLTEQDLRRQAYQAVLSGAAGQVFGNNPLWHFNGPGLYAAAVTWREALGSRGAVSMTHLRGLFDTLPWWRLRPDRDNRLLTGAWGWGEANEHDVAALSDDRMWAVVYLPKHRAITVDLSQLAGPLVKASWFDPAGGGLADIGKFPLAAAGKMTFQPPGRNGAGFDDWVLVLQTGN